MGSRNFEIASVAIIATSVKNASPFWALREERSMIGTLGSTLTRVVTKIPKQCYPVRKLSRNIECVIAKLGANVTIANSF